MKFNDIRTEEKTRLDPACWHNKKIGNPKTKMKGGVRVNNCVPKEGVAEGTNDTIYPGAEVIKTKRGKPVGEIYQDASGWGCHHYDADLGADCIESREEAIEWLKDLHDEHRQDRSLREAGVAEGQLNEYLTQEGSPFADILGLNLFMDMGPDGVGFMEHSLVKKYKPIAGQLARLIRAQKKRKLTYDESDMIDNVWYDGSDAYDDMEVEFLADLYNQQIEVVKDILENQQGVAEDFNPEYDDEAGMAQGSLHTLQNAVEGLQQVIDAGDNLPEWCQEKISLAEDYLVTVWDYIQSEKAQGVDPEIEEMYEAMEQLAEEMAAKKGVSADLVWETFEAMDDNMLYETAAWRRKEGKNKNGGLNAKGVASYRRENPGSKLQTAVTTKPSKLKPGSKAAKRRKSFCARMSGVKGPMKKPNGKPTRKALALRKWNC